MLSNNKNMFILFLIIFILNSMLISCDENKLNINKFEGIWQNSEGSDTFVIIKKISDKFILFYIDFMKPINNRKYICDYNQNEDSLEFIEKTTFFKYMVYYFKSKTNKPGLSISFYDGDHEINLSDFIPIDEFKNEYLEEIK